MYKDKDKQREAQRNWVRQKRIDKKGSTIVKPSLSVSHSIGPEDLLEPTKNKLSAQPKRGKDIKCFADLPPDVQQTINTLSDDKTEHKRRTAIAINYQASLSQHRLYGLSLGVV